MIYTVRGLTRDGETWQTTRETWAEAQAHARAWNDQGLTLITIDGAPFDRTRIEEC